MSALNRVSQSLKKPQKPKKKVKHKKLDEDWFESSRESVKDGQTFVAKYLGLTLVDEPKGEEVSAAAVQRVVDMAKASNSKLQKMQITVSPSGIKVHDQSGANLINDISVYRISFCAAMKNHNKVFSFVAQNTVNETLECHAYLCNTTKEAQELTVSVAQSFKIAFEAWEEEGGVDNAGTGSPGSDLIVINGQKSDKRLPQVGKPSVLEKRYHRLSSTESNPFDTAEDEVNGHETMQKTGKESLDKTANKENDTTGIQPTEVSKETNHKPNSAQTPVITLRPPPSMARPTDKSSPRRSRPTSVGPLISVPKPTMQKFYTPSPSKTHDFEDWDQAFADLALSRTQEKEEPEVADAKDITSYPPSNPFSNPLNPFFG